MRIQLSCLIVLIGLTSSSQAQDKSELNRRNGFKSIKLASPIDSVKGAVLKKEFMEKDEFPARLYETSAPEYMTVGEVDVREIKLLTYQNLIYKIIVNTDKDARVMRALEKSFGKATYVVRTTSYNWTADQLSLTFQAHKNSIELVYRSYPVLRKMMEDKGKKVDRIAEDF
jgi:hypothetical protein